MICTALLGAGVLLLTGCAKETDLSARFPAYMKYSFGDDYTMELSKNGGGKSADEYQISYTDHTGKRRNVKGGFLVYPYEKRGASLEAWSKEEYFKLRLSGLAALEISRIADEEITEEIIKPHFPEADSDSGTKVSASAMQVIEYAKDKQDYALLEKVTAAETGWQVCRADWKTVANSPEWFYFVSVDLQEKTADPAPLIAQAKEALSDYQEKAGAAQNYTFLVRYMNGTEQEVYWEEAAILGKTVESEHYFDDVANAYREQMNGKE